MHLAFFSLNIFHFYKVCQMIINRISLEISDEQEGGSLFGLYVVWEILRRKSGFRVQFYVYLGGGSPYLQTSNTHSYSEYYNIKVPRVFNLVLVPWSTAHITWVHVPQMTKYNTYLTSNRKIPRLLHYSSIYDNYHLKLSSTHLC